MPPKFALQHTIRNLHYVDHFVASFATTNEAIRAAEVVNVHKRGGFELCGFVSNSTSVLEALVSTEEGRDTWRSETDMSYQLKKNGYDVEHERRSIRLPDATKRDVGWDEPLPEAINQRWQEWRALIIRTRECSTPCLLLARYPNIASQATTRLRRRQPSRHLYIRQYGTLRASN